MAAILIKLVLAPALVAAATLAVRRWGARVGGIVSAFPAIVGPLLLIVALEHGAGAAAQTAGGVLLGLVALAAFAVAYGRCARRHGWAVCLAAGWACAAAGAGLAGALGRTGSPSAAVVAAVSLGVAALALPAGRVAPRRRSESRPRLLERMAAAVVLVAGLSAGVDALGPTAGGVLAALPAVASLLAVFTHREAGAAAAIELLRGTVIGMAAFVAFCQLVAVMIVPDGAPVAFAVATVAALLVQAVLTGYPISAQAEAPST